MVKEKEPLFVVGLEQLLHKKFYYCGRNMLQKINETHNLIAFATTRQNSKISDWVACDYHAENYFISHAYKVHDGGKKVTFSGTGDHSPIYSAYAAARSQRRHKNLVKLQIPGSRLYVM